MVGEKALNPGAHKGKGVQLLYQYVRDNSVKSQAEIGKQHLDVSLRELLMV